MDPNHDALYHIDSFVPFPDTRNYPGVSFSFARSSMIPHRPYIILLTIFSLLFVPSTKPLLRGDATAFSTASMSLSRPRAKEENSFIPQFSHLFSTFRLIYPLAFFKTEIIVMSFSNTNAAPYIANAIIDLIIKLNRELKKKISLIKYIISASITVDRITFQ